MGDITVIAHRLILRWLNLLSVCLIVLAALQSCTAHAQNGFPSKPLRIIAPFSPGSGVDAIARIYARRLSEQLGVPVVVENKEGAGGMIGAGYAAKLPADGYSMLIATTPFVVGPITQGNASYDPIKDFDAVGRVAVNPLALIVNPTVPAKTMMDLIAYARANPGALTYASSGPGTPSQLEMEALKSKLEIDIREIPYRSNAQALTDVIGGIVSMYYTVQSTSLGNLQSGQVRALAVASPKPTLALPDVPTMAEAANLPGYEAQIWYGIVVPRGTPPDIVKRLNAELIQATKAPEVVAAVQKLGFELAPSSPDEFAASIIDEAAKATSAKKR
jgi:tripartite-type tricarboxylate transporter receptor subunit TctC